MLKKTACILILLAAGLFSRAQYSRERLDQITDSITTEGKTLYRSEWTSWYGTDVFEAKCPQRQNLQGGYFSYETDQNLVNIFFSRDETPRVIASITFQKAFNKDDYLLDTSVRNFTPTEQKYFDMRQAAVGYMHTDTIFKGYKNTTLNLVPIVEKDARRVYVLTGTSLHGVVIFGNDYLLTMDKDNKVSTAEKLHKSIIPAYFSRDSTKYSYRPCTPIYCPDSHLLPPRIFVRSCFTSILQPGIRVWCCQKIMCLFGIARKTSFQY